MKAAGIGVKDRRYVGQTNVPHFLDLKVFHIVVTYYGHWKSFVKVMIQPTLRIPSVQRKRFEGEVMLFSSNFD